MIEIGTANGDMFYEHLTANETPQAVTSASKWLPDGWGSVNVMLTNRRLLLSKDKMFGKPKLDAELPLVNFDSIGSGPVQHFGVAAIRIGMRDGQECGLIFTSEQDCVALEGEIRRAVDAEHVRALELLDRLHPEPPA